MSEARSNANQVMDDGAAAAPANGTSGGVLPVGVTPIDEKPALDFPRIAPGSTIRIPDNEADADRFLMEQVGEDPEKLRTAGRAFMERLERMAARVEASKTPAAAASAASSVQAAPPPAAPPPAAPPPAAPAAPPTAPAAAAPAEPARPAEPPPWAPAGYLPMPEGVFTWTPADWGGRPLHFVPTRVFKRDRESPILIGILLAPAYARNRAGRVVSLPQGARVAIHAGIGWMPMLALAEGAVGRPVLIARPTPVDPFDPAGPSVIYERGDGSREWGIEVQYEPSPDNPSHPRLIALETVQGAGSGGAE